MPVAIDNRMRQPGPNLRGGKMAAHVSSREIDGRGRLIWMPKTVGLPWNQVKSPQGNAGMIPPLS
jgi:hypothetical protein